MSVQFDHYHVWLGIPPDQQPPNHYRLLGLQLWEADRDVISNALDQRLAYLRTLQAGKRVALSQELLNEVTSAGITLLDSIKKRDYDQQLHSRWHIEAQVAALPTVGHLDTRPTPSRGKNDIAPRTLLRCDGPTMPVSVVTPIPPAPIERSSNPAATFVAPPSVSSKARSRGSNGGLAIAIVGVCAVGLAVAVGTVIWTTQTPQLPREDAAITTAPKTPAVSRSDSQEQPVTPEVAPSIASTSSPVVVSPADSREVWVYADSARGGFRRITQDRWVELSETEDAWYRQTHVAQDEIILEQMSGALTQVRLFSDRLEKGNPEQNGVTVFSGKWSNMEGLPPFARRAPGPEQAISPPSGDLLVENRTPADTPELPVPIASAPEKPDSRRPLPDAVTLAAELQKARAIYEGDLKEATKPEQKAVLAHAIVKVATQTTDDATARYVLFDLARKVFVQSGAAKEALDAAAVLEKEYELPANDLLIATIEALDATTLASEQRAALATAAIDLAEALLVDERFDVAGKLATLAAQAANRQKDVELKKDVLQRKGQLMRVVSGWEAVEASLKMLADNADDPAANLAVGRFRCLVLENWDLGATNLANSGDSPLAVAAKLDGEAARGTPESAIAAAEAWLKLAEDTKTGDRDERQAIQRRAKSLLGNAVPRLSGLNKVKAEKQLEELKVVETKVVRERRAPKSKAAPYLAIYNTHNWRYGNRRTKECNVILLREGKPIAEVKNLRLNWHRDLNPPSVVPLKSLTFDAIRIELTTWEHDGVGLSEVQLVVDGVNLLRGSSARASAVYNPEKPGDCPPEMVTDGIIDENKDGGDGRGYWMLPPRTGGWIEIAVPK